ncbi:MAG: class I SAM-dependent methyltransferase [Deltaproteobacteria bacterium]|nr:class I SAM-dependent methyltransferase [Deltaproteobacteria bacterium]
MRDIVLRCPDCHYLLHPVTDAASTSRSARCSGCTRTFTSSAGVWDLWPTRVRLTPEDSQWAAHFDATVGALGTSDPLALDYGSRRTFALRQRAMEELVGDVSGQLLLDVGCGNGLMARPLLLSNQVAGVDASLQMAHAAARNGLQAVHAPAFELPFVDGSFDGAFLIEVLQIVSDPYRVLSELTRVVRPGGFVVLLTHNAESLVRRVLYRWFPDEGPAHRMFTLPQLSGWLTSLGCGQIKGRHLFLPVPYSRPASGLPASLLATTLALRAEKLA